MSSEASPGDSLLEKLGCIALEVDDLDAAIDFDERAVLCGDRTLVRDRTARKNNEET